MNSPFVFDNSSIHLPDYLPGSKYIIFSERLHKEPFDVHDKSSSLDHPNQNFVLKTMLAFSPPPRILLLKSYFLEGHPRLAAMYFNQAKYVHAKKLFKTP